MSQQNPKLTQGPRNGQNADKKGAYDLVARINNAIINRGEYLTVEIFITGYGQIGNSKFVFYPSIDIIDTSESTLTYGLKHEPSGTGTLISWGEKTENLDGVGVSVDLAGGWVKSSWTTNEATVYFDITASPTPQIMTEATHFEIAPIVLKLKIKKKAQPGNHFLHFGFTYFNGQEWSGSNQQVQFTIKNVFQKHEIPISILVFIATILTILAAIITVIDFAQKHKRNATSEITKNTIIKDTTAPKPKSKK